MWVDRDRDWINKAAQSERDWAVREQGESNAVLGVLGELVLLVVNLAVSAVLVLWAGARAIFAVSAWLWRRLSAPKTA